MSTHTILFPFVKPIVDALKKAPCNITLMAPAAAVTTKIMRYEVDKYCASGKWAQTDACNTANAIVELDEATVQNAKNIAQQGKQSQSKQHRRRRNSSTGTAQEQQTANTQRTSADS